MEIDLPGTSATPPSVSNTFTKFRTEFIRFRTETNIPAPSPKPPNVSNMFIRFKMEIDFPSQPFTPSNVSNRSIRFRTEFLRFRTEISIPANLTYASQHE